jgi:hypothetical protein
MAQFGPDTRYPNEYNIVHESLDPMNPAGPGFGLGTDSSVSDFLNEVFQGGYGGTQSPEEFNGPGPEQMGPQDFIRQQLAGDVVNMPLMKQMNAVDRMSRTDAPFYMGGQQTIQGLGGAQSPYLDLLNVLAFPGGGSMAPPIRRR